MRCECQDANFATYGWADGCMPTGPCFHRRNARLLEEQQWVAHDGVRNNLLMGV